MQLWSQFIRRGANGEKELFQCPQISGFLFYLPSTTPNILITSIFDSTYTYTVPIRFGKHVTYSLIFGSNTRRINLVFINKDCFYSFCTCCGNSGIHFNTTRAVLTTVSMGTTFVRHSSNSLCKPLILWLALFSSLSRLPTCSRSALIATFKSSISL